MERIVVGVDGSPCSRTAFAWAVEDARRRNAEIDAVAAWSVPVLGYNSGYITPPEFAREELARDARKALDEVCDSVDTRGLVVRRVVQEASASELLVDTARGADLLVVGSRGRGGFAGLLLGSVSQQCAHHAPCPLVIVR